MALRRDGVIHVVNNVLIPPKPVDRDSLDWDYGEEMPLGGIQGSS